MIPRNVTTRLLARAVSLFEVLLLRGDFDARDAKITRDFVRKARRALGPDAPGDSEFARILREAKDVDVREIAHHGKDRPFRVTTITGNPFKLTPPKCRKCGDSGYRRSGGNRGSVSWPCECRKKASAKSGA